MENYILSALCFTAAIILVRYIMSNNNKQIIEEYVEMNKLFYRCGCGANWEKNSGYSVDLEDCCPMCGSEHDPHEIDTFVYKTGHLRLVK